MTVHAASYKSAGMKPTEFHIEFDNQETVTFNLVDHEVVTAWAYLLMGYWDAPDQEIEQVNRGFCDELYEDAVTKMNQLGPHIREHFLDFFGEDFIRIMEKPFIDRDDLNILHDGYEKLQAQREDQPVEDVVPDEVLYAQALNETIHYMERWWNNGMLYPIREASPRVRIRMLHTHFKWSGIVMMPYQERDFDDLFELYTPGRLYLTYTKVGKPPLSIYRDRDDHAEEPVPWRLFGPSFNFTLFGAEPVDDFEEARAWLKEHTGRDDWALGDPKIGELHGDPIEIWNRLGSDPRITNLSFTWE